MSMGWLTSKLFRTGPAAFGLERKLHSYPVADSPLLLFAGRLEDGKQAGPEKKS